MTAPSIHVVKSRKALSSGEVAEYAYVRYQVYDEAKGRHQPKPLLALGRTSELDMERVGTLAGFLKEWVKKDSDLPIEALAERMKEENHKIRILCSRDFGLRWVMEQAWQELGYNEAIEELCRRSEVKFRLDLAVFAMILARLVTPRSKRGITTWGGMEVFLPEAEGLETHHLYRAMDVLAREYAYVERIFNKTLVEKHGLDAKQISQDTTTVSFAIRYDDKERKEIEEERQRRGEVKRAATVNEPPLRMRGHSKSKRGDLPQIVVELNRADHGLLVHHRTHSGNTSDKSIVEETVDRIAELGYEDVTWTADAGVNSTKNRNLLRNKDFALIFGEGVSRTKVAKKVLAHPGRYHPHPEKPELSYKCVRLEATEEQEKGSPGPIRLYLIRRHEGERKHQLHRIERHIQKIETILETGGPKKVAGLIHHKTFKKYVREDKSGKIRLNRKRIKQLKRNAGKSIIGTDDLEATPLEIDGIYRRLFEVERIFRQLKSTVQMGPVRHRRSDRIEADIMLDVMAQNLVLWLQKKSGRTFEELQEIFCNVRVQNVQIGKATYWQTVELTELQKGVLDALGYDHPPRRFVTKLR